jgi:hypothetical protein
MISSVLNLNRQTVHEILKFELVMQKICAKLVPKILTNEQKENRRNVCLDLLERIENEKISTNFGWSAKFHISTHFGWSAKLHISTHFGWSAKLHTPRSSAFLFTASTSKSEYIFRLTSTIFSQSTKIIT